MTRIIAGRAGGRRLATPDSDRTRPTSDRVREALFSAVTAWAGALGEGADQELSGLSFLDLYAGSGAIGLEAASRGAGPVTLVESDAQTAKLIRTNARNLGLSADVRASGVDAFLAGEAGGAAYDVIWLDPPYAVDNDRLGEVLRLIAAGGRLAEDGLIVAERSRRTPPPPWPPGLRQTRARRYGDTTLYFAEPDPAAAP